MEETSVTSACNFLVRFPMGSCIVIFLFHYLFHRHKFVIKITQLIVEWCVCVARIIIWNDIMGVDVH